MAEFIDVTLENGEQVQLDLRRLALGLNDLRPFWRLFSPIAQSWLRQQFMTQGAFSGAEWPPLSPAYARRKVRLWGDRPLLVASGTLRDQVYRPKMTFTPQTLTMEIDEGARPIAAFHQKGNARMPARPLLFSALPEEAKVELEHAGAEYIRSLIDASRA